MNALSAAPTPERLLYQLEWRVIRRLDGLLQGDYRTLFYGTGIDFADLREYEPRDDVRNIDWNVTARMNSPYVRQYIEDREITAWFLLDLSPSMDFGATDRSKDRVLIDFVVTMARLLTRNGNRVGAILYKDKIERTIPAKGGRIQVLRLAHELLRDRSHVPGKPTDLKVLLDAGLSTCKRRSVIFLISDFFSEPGWERPLSILNRRHELIAVRLSDPWETELPNAGLVVVEDAETGEQITVDTSDPSFRRRFAEVLAQREASLHTAFRKAGADIYSVSTNEDLARSILIMANQRKKRRR